MIKDILTEESVVTDVEVQDWRQAVRVCGGLLTETGKIESVFIEQMIGVVEEFGPYMILVPEVAFFHGPPGPAVKDLGLSLITLAQPVYFSDYANQKISCAFGFAAIDSNSHLQLLKEVSELLQDEDFLELITHNGDKNTIMEVIGKY